MSNMEIITQHHTIKEQTIKELKHILKTNGNSSIKDWFKQIVLCNIFYCTTVVLVTAVHAQGTVHTGVKSQSGL